MEFKIDFDTKQFEAALEQFADEAPKALGDAMFIEGEDIMGRSKEEFVPVDFGTLRDSGHVQPAVISGADVTVKLGFGGPSAPYAAAVHENPRAGKTGGYPPTGKAVQVNSRGEYSKPRQRKTWAKVGSWKYLQIPLDEAKAGFSERVSERMWATLRGKKLG